MLAIPANLATANNFEMFCLDVTINSICLYFQFKFAQTEYRKVCCCLDDCCLRMVIKRTSSGVTVSGRGAQKVVYGKVSCSSQDATQSANGDTELQAMEPLNETS